MLLRLQVKGFKNLCDVTVQFGPMTCFVGPNGVGKSNLFDAIGFLQALTEKDIQTAAQSVRSPITGAFGPRDLFWSGNRERSVHLVADMLVPKVVIDDFGREARPATTLLRYEIALRLVDSPLPRLELTYESLEPLKYGNARAWIGFEHGPSFRASVAKPTRRVGPLISTKTDGGTAQVYLHQDGGSRGQPFPAGQSPRTVVGGTNAAEYPTVLAARREMASWRALQLEPSAMRAPDPIGGPNHVDVHGGHIAATLARLESVESTPGRTASEAANRLAELVPEVRTCRVDRDEARQQLSVFLGLDGCSGELGPRSISDGTLRFLALVTMQMDPESGGVLCMEEPENGMHPARIPAMVDLLRDFIVDPKTPVDTDNPLRQVILNSHSPDVMRQMDKDEVLFVDTVDTPAGRCATVSAIEHTWRREMPEVPIQRMADFLGGAPLGRAMIQLQLPLEIGTAR